MDLNNFEYGATKAVEGKIKKLKFTLFAIYAAFSIVFFTVIFSIKMVMLGALWPFAMYIIVLATYKYVQVDYKYRIEAGTLTLERKYGNSKPVTLTTLRLKDANLIAPLKEYEGKIRDFEPEIVYDAVPSVNTVESYVILYTDNDGKRCALYIEAPEASVKALRYYNSNMIVGSFSKTV
jgi:hypothetical protein